MLVSIWFALLRVDTPDANTSLVRLDCYKLGRDIVTVAFASWELHGD
jgi:hypothetical protein